MARSVLKADIKDNDIDLYVPYFGLSYTNTRKTVNLTLIFYFLWFYDLKMKSCVQIILLTFDSRRILKNIKLTIYSLELTRQIFHSSKVLTQSNITYVVDRFNLVCS